MPGIASLAIFRIFAIKFPLLSSNFSKDNHVSKSPLRSVVLLLSARKCCVLLNPIVLTNTRGLTTSKCSQRRREFPLPSSHSSFTDVPKCGAVSQKTLAYCTGCDEEAKKDTKRERVWFWVPLSTRRASHARRTAHWKSTEVFIRYANRVDVMH